MQEQKIVIQLSGEEIQVLNNIITNSIPTVSFGTVTQLVANINAQLQEELKRLQEPVQTPVEVETGK